MDLVEGLKTQIGHERGLRQLDCEASRTQPRTQIKIELLRVLLAAALQDGQLLNSRYGSATTTSPGNSSHT